MTVVTHVFRGTNSCADRLLLLVPLRIKRVLEDRSKPPGYNRADSDDDSDSQRHNIRPRPVAVLGGDFWMRLTLLACAVALGFLARTSLMYGVESPLTYPPSRRVDQVDRYHGSEVADPYRWLEADIRQSKEVAAWVRAQNEVTAKYVGVQPNREAIRKRLKELWNYERYSSPMRAGTGYAFFRNDGLQNHAVLYVTDTMNADPRLLIDPNRWSILRPKNATSARRRYSDPALADVGVLCRGWLRIGLCPS